MRNSCDVGTLRPISVLLVEAHRGEADALALSPSHPGLALRRARSLPEGLALLGREDPDAVLLQLAAAPDAAALEAVARLRAGSRRAAVVVCAADAGEQAAVSAIRAGAQAYLPVAEARLPDALAVALRQAVERQRAVLELEIAREHDRFLATHDPLTGLANRLLFHDRLAQAIALAERNRAPLALLYVDLDHVKRVNDGFGHETGDALLRHVAERMRGVVRRSDTVARLGGDEFAIVLGSIARELDAGRVAEKILATLARPMPIGATICSASASIGIATYPSDALDAEALVRSADHAMYQAKQHGRGRYEFFAGALGSRSSERLELERKLHHAVDHERLEARYALETDGTGERVVSLEASVAWRHPEHGLLPPDRTLALAVETREIVPIGGWLVRRALRDLAALREAGRGDLRLSLRVCESQLVAAGFVPLLHDALGEHGVPPDRVELAVGEDVFHGRSELGLRTLEACAALGVRIGWCGAGRAALSPARLAELPGSALALDAALAARLPEDPVACAIAAAVAALARGLGLEAVADGVEGPAQAELLASQGYTRLRGPWLGDPLAADTLPGALRREPAKLGPRGSPD